MKTTARLAYETHADQIIRVVALTDGRVFRPGEGWTQAVGQITTVPGPGFDSWSDVPFAWVGGVPYWSQR